MISKIIFIMLFIMLNIWVISTFIVMDIKDRIERRKRKNQAKEIINRMIKNNDFFIENIKKRDFNEKNV